MNFRLYFVICVLSYTFSSGQRLVSGGKTISSISFVETWTADKAVDGDAIRAPNSCNCCAATNNENEPWYKLDLGEQYKIYSISVLGRGGAGDGGTPVGYGHTLKNMQIKLGTTESNGQEITRYSGKNYTYDYTLPTPQDGRYLTLTLRGMKQYFVICELSVYAVCDGNTYGPDCVHTCGNCKNGETCDTVDGECTDCATGYKSPLCQDCIDGRYGSDCQEKCGKCENDDPCNTEHGTCLRCRTGYKPPLCLDCIDGRYGSDCQEKCGKCENDDPCNTEHGTCLRCRTGYKPPLCLDCIDGRYGSDCQEKCGKCENDDPCNTEHGTCLRCRAGYKPPLCLDCIDGRYGSECLEICGKCENDDPCNTGDGTCSRCVTGYKPSLCQDCVDGRYGSDCQEICGMCENNDPCHTGDGRCLRCRRGYKPPLCLDCIDGRYGSDCLEICGKCENDDPCNTGNGTCSRCRTGYKPALCQECDDFFYGNDCSQICHCLASPCDKGTGICPDGGCREGYKGDKCNTPCKYGKYGQNCEEVCGRCNNNDTCDKFHGNCQGCAPGYRGNKCKQVCRNGTYGQDCRETCGQCFNNEVCNHVDGHCTRCAAGYKETDCKTECDSRTFGFNCSQKCGQCLNRVQCNIVNGSCPAGCDPGFDGVLCDATCDIGKYGEKCANSCGNCYQQDTCDAVTGLCKNTCSAGYIGTYCKEACPVGKFGRNCISTCGNCLNNTICSRLNGSCDAGCELGYEPPLCRQECENGTYGLGCIEKCGQCLDGKTCDKRNGTCTVCEPGYIDPLCKVLSQVDPSPDTTPPVAPIIGAVVGVVVLAAVGILAVIFYRRRQNENNTKPAKAAIPSFADIDENQSNEIPAVQKAPLNVKKEQPSTAKKPDEPKNTEEEDIYYAFLSKKTDLKICQLWDYIHLKKRDENLLFYQEYNRLPGELKYPCNEAKKAKNAGKNRYRGLYAYDRTRVPLTIEEAGEGNYINASFIHGFEKQKKFIASQGPTENMRTDFWRMVWQQKSKSIVMLTKLTELGTEKCILYWPEAREVAHGNITIRHVSEEVTVDFTIRQFEIFKGNENNRLPVTQYHFQAWPDKSTPDSTWCLVKFWLRVMQDTANMEDSGPIVVHCSAGIGRTGTFIALDNAYNQAKMEGTVRILDMVTTIREQRVKMVQTRDQYVYLHEAVADALLFGTHFVWSSQFEELYEYLTDVPLKSRISRLQTQFNLIVESVQDKKTVHTTLEETDNEYSNVFIHGKHQQQVSIDEYRPKSKSQKYVREVGALILQNHEEKGAFIICKSPAEAYLSEFWSLVQEQNIKTIVSLSYSKNSSLGLSNKMIQTKFGLSQTEERKKQTFTESKISLSDNMDVSYFQYKNWSSGDNIPKDARSMVQFVEAILDCQRRLSDTEPVLVYCNNGVKQSGLLCVLLSEFNRINRAGGYINIIKTVKMMKDRNVDIIENFDQYRYIYDVILARLHESTYQNQ